MKNEEKYNLTTTFFFIGIFSFPFLMALSYLSLFLSLIFLIKEFIEKKSLGSLVKSQLDYAVLAFFAVSILSLVNLNQPYANLGEACTGVLRVIAVTICYFIAKNVANQETLKKTVWLLLIQSFILAIYGIMQFAFQGFTGRISSFTDNPNTLPQYFIISTPFVITMLFWPLKKWSKVFVISTLTLVVIALCLTFSRGGWLGFLASLVFFSILTYKKLLPWLMTASISAILFIIPYSIIQRSDSNLERLSIWKSSWEMFRQHMLFGIGLSQFKHLYPSYILPPWHYIHSHAHNIFFQRFVELGLVGGLTFLTLIFIVAKSSQYYLINCKEKAKSLSLIACLAGLSGILVYGLFDDPMSNDGTFILIWIILGFFESLKDRGLTQRSCNDCCNNIS